MNETIVNKSNEEVNLKDIKNICKITFKKLKVKNPIFNIIIVNNEEIRKLNKKYRKIDDYTDVISFALEDYKDIGYNNIRLLGDIYISIDKAKEQAISYNHSLKREICFLTVHGLLHLLGFDHQNKEEEKVMRELEESVLSSYEAKR